MTWPRPWQVGQVRSTVKKPDCERTAPTPPQVLQVLGDVPGLAPDARTDVAGDRGGHADLRRLAGEGLGEADFHVVAQIGAARGAAAAAPPARPPRPAAAAHEVAEQILENIRHGGGEFGPEAGAAGPRPPPMPPSKA